MNHVTLTRNQDRRAASEVLELVKALGNVSAACKQRGVPRRDLQGFGKAKDISIAQAPRLHWTVTDALV